MHHRVDVRPASSLQPRRLLRAAAIYNAMFGSWAVLAPGQFLALVGIDGSGPAEWLWQCIGMIVGIYGILYWHAADHPERSAPIVAVGLLGKVLGPLGWMWTFAQGRIAATSFVVIAANDLVWWPGFTAILLRAAPPRWHLRLLAAVMFVTHAAGGALLALATWRTPPLAAQAVPWTMGWAMFCVADLFSPAFVNALLAANAPATSRRLAGLLRWLVCAAAIGDLLLNVACAAAPPAESSWSQPWHRLLSLTGTNGVFLVVYAVLSLVLWRARQLPHWTQWLGVPAWLGAAGLCLCGVGWFRDLENAFGVVLLVGYCCWLVGPWIARGL